MYHVLISRKIRLDIADRVNGNANRKKPWS